MKHSHSYPRSTENVETGFSPSPMQIQVRHIPLPGGGGGGLAPHTELSLSNDNNRRFASGHIYVTRVRVASRTSCILVCEIPQVININMDVNECRRVFPNKKTLKDAIR